MTDHNVIFKVLRYRPETDSEPHYETYEVPCSHETSILDALNYIRDNLAPDLSYRSSCRMAVCGSCALMINNTAGLACKTFVRNVKHEGTITLDPLENFPVERDLVVDITDMIQKLERVQPYIVPNPDTPKDKPTLQTPQQLERYRQFSQCIQCGSCYAACPQYKLHPDFLGPAALTLLYRYNHDTRDCGSATRHQIMGEEKGLWRCTSVGYCSDVCPKLVDPAAAVQLGKEENTLNFFKQIFLKHKS